MKNHWLDKATNDLSSSAQFIKDLEGEIKLDNLPMGDGLVKDRGSLGCDFCKCDFTQDEGWTEGEMLFFINKMGEQKLAAWLIRKYKDDPQWLKKTAELSGVQQIVTHKSGFPQDDEYSKQAGCCGDFACNCTVNLDMFYNTQFCQGEIVKEARRQENKIEYIPTECTPIVIGTMDGKVYEGDILVQTFTMSLNGMFEFTRSGREGSSILTALCNLNTGELYTEWDQVPTSETRLVVNYEFNYEPPSSCGSDVVYPDKHIKAEKLQAYNDGFLTTYTPIICESMSGEIYLGTQLIQTFKFDKHGVFHSELKDKSHAYVTKGSLNLITGEVVLKWSGDVMYNYNGQQTLMGFDDEVNIVIDYEYNKEF